MYIILTSIFFVLGLIIGSFLNVVVCRIGTHKTFGGRSFCMDCNTQIPWYDMFPVASFCVLKGRCRNCKSSISSMYPIVEFITGLVFVLLFFKFSNLFFIAPIEFALVYGFYAVIFSLLIVVSVYDLRHKIIPDILSLSLGILSFASLFLISNGNLLPHIPSLESFLAGPMMAFPFAFFFFISGGRWMGFGDAKLGLSLGWILGVSLGLSALAFAFWLGAIVGVILILLKRYGMKSEIPFAPFLVFATVITFLFEINILEVIGSFS